MTHQPRSRGPAHDRWLVSYADFMTLLFAFFAMMYAISSVDSQKLTKVAHALQVAFDDSSKGRSIASGSGVMPERGTRLVPGAAPEINLAYVVTQELAAEVASRQVEVSVDRRGLVLSIPEAGVFAIGSDELSPAATGLVGRIAATLAKVPNAVRIEGHTDDLPIHTARFRSNWDLSTARATRVTEFLIERGRLDAGRLSAAGYAEFRPRTGNVSPETRAQNRRVDLIVLNETTVQSEEPARVTR